MEQLANDPDKVSSVLELEGPIHYLINAKNLLYFAELLTPFDVLQ